jgi:hypothetical protein
VEAVKIITGNNGLNENENNRKENDGGINASNVNVNSGKVLDV